MLRNLNSPILKCIGVHLNSLMNENIVLKLNSGISGIILSLLPQDNALSIFNLLSTIL